MPKLRLEPKVKAPITEAEYGQYKDLLRTAKANAEDHHVFVDLEEGENSSYVRKAINYVAEKEGVSLRVTLRRLQNTFSLSFGKSDTSPSRRSASEARGLIVEALKKAGTQLQRSEILRRTGLSAGTWNIRIRELLRAGLVKKDGKGRDTSYRVVKSGSMLKAFRSTGERRRR